ncbi:MAG TPA: maltose alpha-D-glucosyltransferase [Stellaceae bacterium]|jgi:maltose alpha-D-glucosyltransferase/alpha-amylase|nr:maltose alpha-D-glucosyltransferase [Stellaceae bacterium]
MRKKHVLPVMADPLWYKDAVIYQLHVKSFFDSNGDGVGDLSGLVQKLDYIQSLGVNAIWLLPFYPSPRRDDGYDIADYRGVHPDYGTLADFRRFIAGAHERDMRVITELVINHTSDQHAWFQRARAAKAGSAARRFYVWSDHDNAYADTRVIFVDTEKSNWTWDPVAGAYYWHRFYAHQPDLNFDNPRVLQEVLSVMRFWLDLGVDGLRLDAVPYLVEREGTSNENLPETHAVLKKLRKALDDYAPGRMLLAEANQWPEDAQEYFGDGDECHMSFHFPLMPRMYMAIAQEDRFPISDIIRQTPEIPATCQWAIFLRNHDELTLEMVTDKERDLLWDTYAADRRARLNLGIRRRLAPLLEHDRNRIELMNMLLLSMPGTPVIYYGDELGMGDNFHLGDRDGVRTPMQWSPDRNGGFSRSSPENLVLPSIMNPVYGYEAINVEAQAGDQYSLLNWTRRMLTVRKRHKAFGRGTLRFLYPGNRKVLAYLREFGDETILCVCNVSRVIQAVELDLSAFGGRIPVDLTGGSTFPPLGQLPYLLTLPPFAFYWFILSTDASLPEWHLPAPEPMDELRTLVLRTGIVDVLSAEERRVLEQDVLPSYLARRRWFASKDEKIVQLRISVAEPISGAGLNLILTEIEVTLSHRTESYLLPLAIAWDDGVTDALPQQLALARVRRGRRVGYLTDAFATDGLPTAVLRALAISTVRPLAVGEIRFRPTARLAELDIPRQPEIRRLSAEQSNSSLIIGDLAVFKLVRRVFPGIHPEAEMGRYLTEHGFANTAPLLGEVTRYDSDGMPHTLVLVQGFLRNQGDGWGWTLDYLSRVLNSAAVIDPEAQVDDIADALAGYSNFAAAIGRRLAELHAVLAAPTDDPDFAPQIVTRFEIAGWADAARAQLDAALTVIAGVTEWPDADSKAASKMLLERRAALADAVGELAKSAIGTLKTRVHGDFHLGQVLVSSGDAYIIDFEGEPAKPLDERRAKSCPLRDVAGLLRSFDYAVATASRRADGPAQSAPGTAAILDRFTATASEAFLAAYSAAHAESPRQWVGAAEEPALLDLFLIEKAAYEICYEAANRPGWIGIPLHGLAAIATRVAAPAKEAHHG